MTERRPETIERTNEASREVGKLVLDIIQSRRSIREGFIDKPVPNDVITEIIRSGLTAPSSKNAQPWRLHVVHRGEILDDIADYVQGAKDASRYVPIDPSTGEPRQWSSTVPESARVLREIGVGLFIENSGAFSGGRHNVVANSDPDLRRNAVTGYGLEVIGLGAMVQNMWLSAHAQGLGGVFMGDVGVAERDIQQQLGFSGDLVGVLALGYTEHLPYDKQLRTDTVVFHTTGEEGT
jgi:nitroreductase